MLPIQSKDFLFNGDNILENPCLWFSTDYHLKFPSAVFFFSNHRLCISFYTTCFVCFCFVFFHWSPECVTGNNHPTDSIFQLRISPLSFDSAPSISEVMDENHLWPNYHTWPLAKFFHITISPWNPMTSPYSAHNSLNSGIYQVLQEQ